MSHLFWYTARAAGIVAWALLAASVVWGLWLSGRVRPFGVRPAWVLDLHRFLGGLATIFVGVHVLAILADSYTSFGLSDVLVPFASSWHPLAVELTSLARKHLPNRIWRAIHMSAFPLYAFATIHYLSAGTDATNPMSLAAIAVATGCIVALTIRRVSEMRARAARRETRTEQSRIPSRIPPRTEAPPAQVN